MTNERAQTELAERCEKAAGPDRELDAQIIEALGYHRTVEGSYYTGPILRYYGKGPIGEVGRLKKLTIPKFTASLDAAMTLVPEGWRAGFEENASCDEPGKAYAWVWPFESNYDPDWQMGQEGQQGNPDAQKGYAATPALALCAAALRARSQ
jgi:hypothetical protein